MHESAVTNGSEQERKSKVKYQNAGGQIAGRNHNSVTRPERQVVKNPAILAECDLAFGAAVEIVEDDFRQAPPRLVLTEIGSNTPGARFLRLDADAPTVWAAASLRVRGTITAEGNLTEASCDDRSLDGFAFFSFFAAAYCSTVRGAAGS